MARWIGTTAAIARPDAALRRRCWRVAGVESLWQRGWPRPSRTCGLEKLEAGAIEPSAARAGTASDTPASVLALSPSPRPPPGAATRTCGKIWTAGDPAVEAAEFRQEKPLRALPHRLRQHPAVLAAPHVSKRRCDQTARPRQIAA